MKTIIRTFFKIVRAVVGPVLLLLDKLTSPRGVERDPQQQASIDADCQNLKLYQFRACPFCIKTRRAIKRLSLNIETRDARLNPEHRQQLQDGGGVIKVPCLRIYQDDGSEAWLYESNDIIQYLETRYPSSH